MTGLEVVGETPGKSSFGAKKKPLKKKKKKKKKALHQADEASPKEVRRVFMELLVGGAVMISTPGGGMTFIHLR